MKSMNLQSRIQWDICTIYIEGDLVNIKSQELQAYVASFLNDEHLKAFVLHLGRVEFIDSSGMGVIFAAFKEALKQTKGFSLCQLNPHLASTFDKVGLHQIIEIFDTEEEAITNFK